LMAIHVDVLRTWLKDDSEDQAKTMAALDRRLGQANHLMATLCRLAPRRGTASAEQAA